MCRYPVTRSPIHLVIIFWLAGCAMSPAIPPTLISPAIAPELPTVTPSTPVPALHGGVTGVTAVIAATQSAAPPTPEGSGIEPGQAQRFFVRDAGPAAPVDFRPPPYAVPLSIHPDDHYWLGRPLPSDRRTYDLEWYPFGNDVLLPDKAPYRIHHGIDLPNETGAPILAAGSGTVIHAGELPSPRNGVNYYGNTVVIQHDWQWQDRDVFTLYAHTLELFVQAGDRVEQGQLIAGVGSSGEVTDSHLHFEVRVGTNNYNDARNPALWLVPYEGWGTLAGRLVDRLGRPIPGAKVVVQPVNVNAPVRVQRTYSLAVRSDEVWQENFVVGDLPAGDYLLEVTVTGDADSITYQREVTIKPGQTSYEVIATQFEFVPTPTPTPAPTATTAVTVTLPISPTATVVDD